MTGFRLAYLIAPIKLLNYILKLITNTTTCVPGFIQLAGVQALQLDDHNDHVRQYYRNKMKKS